MTQKRGEKRTLKGVVCGSSMDKTIRVRVTRTIRHPRYNKFVKRFSTYMAHDEANSGQVGDTVVLVESKPYSKAKRWRLRQVLEKAVN